MSENNSRLSKEDLKEIITALAAVTQQPQVDIEKIITAAIAAAKAPNVIEQKKLDAQEKAIEQQQQERIALSESLALDREGRKNLQLICSHEHRNGDSHCVYVMEKHGPGYMLCQKNQCIIRPEPSPANYKGTAQFNTGLFNKLFQKLSTNEIFG